MKIESESGSEFEYGSDLTLDPYESEHGCESGSGHEAGSEFGV
jgi:hypothetical protein